MKIEAFFKPQAKAANAGQPGSNPSKQQLAEQREKQRQAAVEQETKDIMPSLDRDVDKAGGSGGPLSECTNKRPSGQAIDAPAAKKQQLQQDVQSIDLCDSDDDDRPAPAAPAAAAVAAAGACDTKLEAQQQGQDQEQQQAPAEHAQQQDSKQTALKEQYQQQQGGQQHEQKQEGCGDADAMDVDTDIASPSAPGSKAASPAPSTAAAAAEAGHKQPATPAAPASAAAAAASGAAAQQQPETPAAAAKADAAAEVPSAVKSTAGKAAAQVLLTPEQRTQLLEQCQQELPLLEAELEVRPDLSGHLEADSKKPLDLKNKVSILVEGQALPLTELSELISRTLSSGSSSGQCNKGATTPAPADPAGLSTTTQDAAAAAAAAVGEATTAAGVAAGGSAAAAGEGGAGGPSALVVRHLIQEVASRKSYGLQDGALADVDALEDASLSFHWCWELRTFTGLPKAVKAHADAARKHRKQVLDRLKAASAFLQLAQSLTKPSKAADTKLAKAAAKLAKVPHLSALQAQLHAAVEVAAQQCSTLKAKQAVSRLDKADKEEQAAQAKAEKARQAEAERVAKEAAREAERVAKEAAKAAEAAEKARLKAEKEAQREAKRQQKAEEAARKAAEAEEKAAAAARRKHKAEAAKAGFGSTTGLSKAQNVFKSFFGLPAERPLTPSNDQTSQGQGSQMEEGAAANNNTSKEAARLWALPSGLSEQQVSASAALDQQLPYIASSGDSAAPAADLGELLAAARQHWKAVRGQRKRVWGLPPSWARRPGVAQDLDHVEAAAAALYGEGVDIHRLRCWRRKLIKHFDSVRPPFYGSVPRSRSAAVGGRRPLGEDPALDYEEMSDQDWEEEPEGESLSADEDGDEECGDDEGDDEEGFVVGDGYLSDDEGMRDEEEPLGCTGSQLAAAAAAAGGASGLGGGGCSTDSSATALAHLEAVLDHARSKGRHVLLVNNCPEMQWEPTTQLPPSILSCLRAQVMRTDITAAPPTPAELPHIFGASAAAAAAAGSASPAPAAAAAAGAAADGSGVDAAAAAAGLAGLDAGAAAGAASGRGRPASVFPEGLLPALVQLVHNSKLSMDLLVKQFVESQAAAEVRVAKARVKDKIKEISNMRMVSKAPLYTVKPEVLQAVQEAGAGAAAAAGAGAGAGPDVQAVAEPMQVDGQQATAEGQTQQQQQQEPAAGASAQQPPEPPGATAAAAAVGHKRPPTEAAQGEQQPGGDKQQQPGTKPGPAGASAAAAAAGAGSCPPAKKQRSTPASGIERFFGAPATAPKPQQQPAAITAGGQTQQQQQQEHGTPPSTPKHKLPGVPSLHHSELQSAAAGGSGDAAAAAAGPDGVERSGALPMLTPPSDAAPAEDRPGKGRHSPVPFRLNSLCTVQEAAAATGAVDDAPPPAAAAAAGPDQQQQKQPARQNISHIFKRQQQLQQERGGMSAGQAGGAGRSNGGGGLLGGSSSHLPPAAAAAGGGGGGGGASHTPSRLGAARAGAGGSSSSVSPPGLPEDGSAPGGAFWKQLGHWVVAVREPSEEDIAAAFKVFDEHHLAAALHTMPQNMLSAMVKTLGSHTQSLPMRAACARCISNTVRCLVPNEQAQQQQKDGSSPAPAQGTPAHTPTASAAAAAAAAGGPTPSSASPSSLQPAAAAAADRRPSPSPSASPRSAPMAASFEELCAEPKLLDNLLLCLNPEKLLQEARAARAKASSSSGLGPVGSEAEAEELSRNAAMAVSTMLLVGVPGSPAARLPSLAACSAVTAAAAAELRQRVACVGNWRGALRCPVRSSEDRHRASYSLMAHYALLSDPASRSRLIANKRLATGLLSAVTTRGAKDPRWVIQKWCLLVLSALLSDATLRQWALPDDAALQPLHQGADEAFSSLENLVALLVTGYGRPRPQLSQPDSIDRDVLSHCLLLSEALLDCLSEQQQHQPSLPPRLAQLCVAEVQQQEAGRQGSLRDALQAVAEHEEWAEAAQRAQRLLNVVDGGCGPQHLEDVDMQDSHA